MSKRKADEPPVADDDNKCYVRVGSKQRRGVKGDKAVTCPGFKNIDVTSGSANRLNDVPVKSLSPFTLGPVLDDHGNVASVTFEAWWQSAKCWKKFDHVEPVEEPDGSITWEPTQKWKEKVKEERRRRKGRRRPFGLKRSDGPADMAYLDGRMYSYVESRRFYIDTYRELIEGLPIMAELEKLVRGGQPVMILDGDGPPKDKYPQGMEMTPENWDKMVKDPNYSFGHGYVVARVLAERIYPDLFP